MFSWAQQQMANVAGTREPIYGPSAIQSVAKQAETTPYSELTRDDLKWANMQSTCVETQTFYLTADSGHYGMAQVIYSNVGGIRTTCQFNTKIFYPPATSKPNLWSSTPLTAHAFTDDNLSFTADNLSLSLNAASDTYTIKSAVSSESLVNLTFTRTAPGFQVGKDGKTTFGTDPAQPWGSMRHAFWPRAKVSGAIITEGEGEIDFSGRGMFVHALQGMKPHHAAAKWDFVNLQTPSYSAVLMSYTTPPSYGSTVVSVGGVATDDKILCAGAENTVLHTAVADDKEKEWPEPTALRVEWAGRAKEGVATTTAVMATELGKRRDRVDVMAEVPGFVKAIVGGVSGARPYIYQFGVDGVELSVEEGEGEGSGKGAQEKKESGRMYYEATFISE